MCCLRLAWHYVRVKTFTVRCDVALEKRVAERVAVAAEVEAAWWQQHNEPLEELAERDDWPSERLDDARRELAAEHARLRHAGVLRGARGPWVLPELRALMHERGWLDRRWRPVPPGARRRGRPWGAGDAGYRGMVVLQLPDDIAERLIRACWWSSAPATRRLKAWYDTYGDHWRGEQHGGRRGWTGGRPSDKALANRSRWTEQISTTGSVLREALTRAAASHSAGG